MKKFYILLLALFLVSSACQKTQFSTSTRHMKNGKVSYTNHYHSERIKFAKVHSPKNQIPAPAAQIPTSDAENLIASASNEPVILSMNENRFVSQEEVNLSPMKHNESNFGNSSPDTAKSKSQDKGTADDRFNRQVIKYKNGETKTVKIISQSKDTVMYSLITEPNIVRGVMMEQIDTIIQDSVRAKAEYTQRTDKLSRIGFIFSSIGLVPIVGIPFALLGIIYGASSLSRMNRVQGHYKRRRLAIASVIIGIAGLIGNILFIVLMAGGYGLGGGVGFGP